MPPYISCQQLPVNWMAMTYTVLLVRLQSQDLTSDLTTTKPSAHDPRAKHQGQRGYLEAQISRFRKGPSSSEYKSTMVYPIEPIFDPPIQFCVTNNPMISVIASYDMLCLR